MKVVTLMTPNPHVVTADQPLLAAASLMRDHDVGMIPVVDDAGGRHLMGVITDRDITIRHVAAAHHHDCPCRDVMTRGPFARVAPTDDVGVVLRQMHRFGVRRVLVTDPDGELVGVVATADLLRHANAVGRDRLTRILAELSEPIMIER